MYRAGIAIGLVVVSAALVTGGLMSGAFRGRSQAAPAWARPLSGVQPYVVQRDYGTSRGLTCDVSIYTTNAAALDGQGHFRPGDVTATVCVVRRAADTTSHR